MLAVKNSQGRTVSLLNEELPRLSNLTSFSPNNNHASFPSQHSPPRLHHHHSSSSTTSTRSSDASSNPYSPGSNPPSLSRSDSSDSTVGQTPSPLTPISTGFDNLQDLRHNLPRKFSSTLGGLPSLSTLRLQAKISPAQSSMDFGQQLPNDFTFASTAPPAIYDPLAIAQLTPISTVGLEQSIAPPSLPSGTPTQGIFPTPITAPKSSTKKNQYPCPLSKQYNCSEFFTTSGHAARHAKKHTGKKDAICPECGKGFTRKDNMEQHRRTHSGGRNKSNHSSTSEGSSSSKQTPAAKDSEETKARQKTRQQVRKSRPSSISTTAPPPAPAPSQQPMQTLQQQMPMTTIAALPPQGDMVDPALREQNLSAFFSPTTDLGMGFGFPPNMQAGPIPGFPAPQAPMSLMSTSRNRPSSSPHALAPQALKPASPSAAPFSMGMDKLDILAEASSRRSSE